MNKRTLNNVEVNFIDLFDAAGLVIEETNDLLYILQDIEKMLFSDKPIKVNHSEETFSKCAAYMRVVNNSLSANIERFSREISNIEKDCFIS